METSAFKATVTGVVQGVGFRYYTQRKALVLSGVSGYVKNLSDGRVEVYAEGPEEALQQLLKQIQRGPLGAAVDAVDVEWLPAKGKYQEFQITY
jgi:acylphosphatase